MLFFGISQYIERANQKVAKNKIHEKKKRITITKSKHKKKGKENQQIHNRKRTLGMKKLIRYAKSLYLVLDQSIIPSGPIIKVVSVAMKNLSADLSQFERR